MATTEGGAITGEERLREHTDQLYGAILSFEGKPADYQIAYIDALKRELDEFFHKLRSSITRVLLAKVRQRGAARNEIKLATREP